MHLLACSKPVSIFCPLVNSIFFFLSFESNLNQVFCWLEDLKNIFFQSLAVILFSLKIIFLNFQL